MYASIDEEGVLSISPSNEFDSKQIKKFYKTNKGKPIESVIVFNVLAKD